ncbi:hypothetical protein Clacol_002004 [Clathrus columnatus]|uniref:Uncharacterized protein n=1 Tax=Clathrus columnatus TaxID=1419009 RepID=A0AAV4ZZL3_9AGAM|nr:hypothetical protein Clacol_002004 [Clathrus columnatus]
MDDKVAVIRRALYPPNLRNKPSPTGSWRPNTMRALWKAIPTKQVHEIIERGYKLYLRHQRQKRQAEIEHKFESMRNAMTELTRLDKRLAIEANRQEDPRVKTKEEIELLNSTHGAERTRLEARIGSRLRGLFPRELKLPTDTPSKEGWNHDWKPLAAKQKTTGAHEFKKLNEDVKGINYARE